MDEQTWLAKAFPYVLAIATLTALCVVTYEASSRQLGQLEAALLQLLFLGLSVWTSYRFSLSSAERGAEALVRAHGKKAFRRLVDLASALSRLKQVVATASADYEIAEKGARDALRTVEALVSENIATAASALEDWRDLLPEEIAKLMPPTDTSPKTLQDEN